MYRTTMKVYIAADHAGYNLKQELIAFLRERGQDPQLHEMAYEIEDLGAHRLNLEDDYPDFVLPLAQRVASEPKSRGIVIGGSGQGEAMAANRVKGARAAVYYGPAPHPQTDAQGHELDMLHSTREHNDANILSLGARFLSVEEAKRAVLEWLQTSFSSDVRHVRRLAKLDA